MNHLVLTLNEHGIPLRWSTWQDSIRYKCLDLVVWEMGEVEYQKFGGKSRMTGEISTVKYSSIIAVRGQHIPKRTTPVLNNNNLFGRDRNICGYCGRTFRSEHLTNDHIVPRSKGGAHHWMNCVTACKRCNNYKDDSLLEECGLELLYAPYIPSREEALILRNRNILTDQMEYLSKMLPDHSRLL